MFRSYHITFSYCQQNNWTPNITVRKCLICIYKAWNIWQDCLAFPVPVHTYINTVILAQLVEKKRENKSYSNYKQNINLISIGFSLSHEILKFIGSKDKLIQVKTHFMLCTPDIFSPGSLNLSCHFGGQDTGPITRIISQFRSPAIGKYWKENITPSIHKR